MKLPYRNLDANQGMYLETELEHMKNKMLDVKYPALMARQLIPVDGTTPAGATTISYRVWDHVGMAKLITNYAKDLPNVGLLSRKVTSELHVIATSFDYSFDDIRAAEYTSTPLDSKYMAAAGRVMALEEDDIAFLGHDEVGYQGFINHPNVNSVVPIDGGGGTTDWESKTPDEILSDVSRMVSSIVTTSKGIEIPNTLALSTGPYTHISQTPRSSQSDKTIEEFILGKNPYIKEIVPVYKLDGAAPASGSYDGQDVAILYDRNPDKLWLEVPMEFTAHNAQEDGLKYLVPCEQKTGGLIVPYPKSIAQLNGV